MEEVLSELKQMNQRLNSIENRLESVENQLAVIEVEQQQIKQAVLETNEKVNKLEAIQESQHHIIELLSVRSIQQEAELKRLQ